MAQAPLQLQVFFNALPESAQGGVDSSAFYVNRAQDDEHDPVLNLKQCIEWEALPGSYLFSGLRGSGKTTELNRLIHELQQGGIEAYYCDASVYLNLNDPQLVICQDRCHGPQAAVAVSFGLSGAGLSQTTSGLDQSLVGPRQRSGRVALAC